MFGPILRPNFDSTPGVDDTRAVRTRDDVPIVAALGPLCGLQHSSIGGAGRNMRFLVPYNRAP